MGEIREVSPDSLQALRHGACDEDSALTVPLVSLLNMLSIVDRFSKVLIERGKLLVLPGLGREAAAMVTRSVFGSNTRCVIMSALLHPWALRLLGSKA